MLDVITDKTYSETSPYDHLTSKKTSQLLSPWFSPKFYSTVQIIPCNKVTSQLRSLLPSPVGDLNSEVPLYLPTFSLVLQSVCMIRVVYIQCSFLQKGPDSFDHQIVILFLFTMFTRLHIFHYTVYLYFDTVFTIFYYSGYIYFIQARSQDLERGGSFLVSVDRRIGVCNPNFPAGDLGVLQAPSGVRAEPRRQTHFDNNLLKIGLKSGL